MEKKIVVKRLNQILTSKDTEILSKIQGFLQDFLDKSYFALRLDKKIDAVLEIKMSEEISLHIQIGKADRQTNINTGVTQNQIVEFGIECLANLLTCLEGGPTFAKLDALYDQYNRSVARLPIPGRLGKLTDKDVICLLRKWTNGLNKKLGGRLTLVFPSKTYELYPSWMGKDFDLRQLLNREQKTLKNHVCNVTSQSSDITRKWQLNSAQEGRINVSIAPDVHNHVTEQNVTFGSKDEVIVTMDRAEFITRDKTYSLGKEYVVTAINLKKKFVDPQATILLN